MMFAIESHIMGSLGYFKLCVDVAGRLSVVECRFVIYRRELFSSYAAKICCPIAYLYASFRACPIIRLLMCVDLFGVISRFRFRGAKVGVGRYGFGVRFLLFRAFQGGVGRIPVFLVK